MASLTLVRPAIGLSLADVAHAGHVGQLTEPSTDEDVQEVSRLAGGKSLTHGAWVKLVDHLAVTGGSGVLSIGLELGVALKLGKTQLLAVLVNNGHIPAVGRRSGSRAWGRSWLRGGLWGGLRSGRGLGSLRGWGRLSRLYVLAGRLLVDDRSDDGRCRVNGGRVDGGRSWLGSFVALGHVDSVHDSLDDDVDVLVLSLRAVVVFVSVATVSSVRRGSDGSAGKGSNGESGTHVDRFVWYVCC